MASTHKTWGFQWTTVLSLTDGIALLVVAIGNYLLYLVGLRPSIQSLRHLPGPRATNYILGNAKEIMNEHSLWPVADSFPEPYISWMQQFGGAVYYRVLFEERVQLTDPTAVHHVLHTQAANFPRHPTVRFYLQDMAGGIGLLSSEDALHDRQRAALTSILNTEQINNMLRVVHSQAQWYCSTELATAAAFSSPMNMNTVFQELTLHTLGLVTCGVDFLANPTAKHTYEELQKHPSPMLMMIAMAIPGFTHLPLPSFERRKRARSALLKDLMDAMLDAQIDANEAAVHTLSMLLAGHDTMSTSLCWALYMLSTHPSAMAQVRAEYQAAMVKHGSLGEWSAVAELPFLAAVIQETLRLHPVLPTLPRRVAAQDCHVPMVDGSDILLQKGTPIVVVTSAMHRDPKYWKRARHFIPERFIAGTTAFDDDMNLRGGQSYARHFMPFGLGPKSCIGERFALAALQLVVGTFVANFDFAVTRQANCRHKFDGLAVQPAHLEMSVRPRRTC
ncbi:hypothetical protein LEN26_014481 [Aphanomyces euteiches]|nr:hypothetical protein LEN26_014481 [Aphanomyces euteiches]KAH9115466.1 hypothetical protein AeMF1_010519 [Aphanomyces euteiches]KAH9184993.1 hypothetical protein AeNC1_013031 [Aphanomyces euteiches]